MTVSPVGEYSLSPSASSRIEVFSNGFFFSVRALACIRIKTRGYRAQVFVLRLSISIPHFFGRLGFRFPVQAFARTRVVRARNVGADLGLHFRESDLGRARFETSAPSRFRAFGICTRIFFSAFALTARPAASLSFLARLQTPCEKRYRTLLQRPASCCPTCKNCRL